MRLLNTLTLTLEEIVGVSKKYAILSHHWPEGEVLYEDLRTGPAMGKAGFRKVAEACQLALRAGCAYIWIDTCCVDKTSSAELSEAINSMFAWYRDSEVSYVYLADVDPTRDRISSLDLQSSEWFRRDWTHQELIAPDRVFFFSRRWSLLGDKQSLCEELASVTGIEKMCSEAAK